ncbi:MAG: hypothetical protein IT552_12850 [Sphingomonadaceae bacterium]|nr:hypothetical protein [Sphingomonadaceae bacterium]
MEVGYDQSVKDRSAARPDISATNAGLFRNGTSSGTMGYADFAQSRSRALTAMPRRAAPAAIRCARATRWRASPPSYGAMPICGTGWPKRTACLHRRG